MTGISILGLIPEYCALFLLVVIIFVNRRKNEAKKITDERQKLVKTDFINCEIITLIIIAVDIIRYSVHIPTIEYLAAMLFHCSIVVVSNCITTYIYDILPSLKENAITFYKVKNKITLTVVCAMTLLAPTGIIYGLVDDRVVAGKLFFISYLVGAVLFFICMFGAYKSKVSRKIRHTLYAIIVCTIAPCMFEVISRNAVTSGIGFVAGLIMLSGMFHDGVFDMTHGTESFVNIGRRIRKGHKVIVFKLKPNKEIHHAEIDEKTHKVLMTIKERYSSDTIYESNGRYAIIVNADRIGDIIEIWNNIADQYNNEFMLYSIAIEQKYLSKINLSILSEVELSATPKAFNDSDINKINRRKAIKNTILSIISKDSFDDDRLLTVVQPIKDIKTGKFLTGEMLTRLKVDDEVIMPNEFIPIIEELNCVHKFNLFILNSACKLMRQIKLADIEFNSISVNFDPIELTHSSFVKDVANIVYSNGVSPKHIHIEITESSELEDSEKTRVCINDLISLGFEVYLDDFGTKYSNVVELLSSKFDVIKIDRQLILKALEDDAAYKVVTALSSACSAVGYKVLFEGVDSEEGIKLAHNNDATYIQGFCYSKPLEWNDFMEFINNENQAQLKAVE